MYDGSPIVMDSVWEPERDCVATSEMDRETVPEGVRDSLSSCENVIVSVGSGLGEDECVGVGGCVQRMV